MCGAWAGRMFVAEEGSSANYRRGHGTDRHELGDRGRPRDRRAGSIHNSWCRSNRDVRTRHACANRPIRQAPWREHGRAKPRYPPAVPYRERTLAKKALAADVGHNARAGAASPAAVTARTKAPTDSGLDSGSAAVGAIVLAGCCPGSRRPVSSAGGATPSRRPRLHHQTKESTHDVGHHPLPPPRGVRSCDDQPGITSLVAAAPADPRASRGTRTEI